MTKKLHEVRIVFDTMVVAEDGVDPVELAKSELKDIVLNDKPSLYYVGQVQRLDEDHPWYSAIPYGDNEELMTCRQVLLESQSEEDKLKSILKKLTEHEREILQKHIFPVAK